jgi:hypothetical protein
MKLDYISYIDCDINANSREPLVPLIVKSVKNPRSALCKTALMTCADIFKAYGELMVDSVDLLVRFFSFVEYDVHGCNCLVFV